VIPEISVPLIEVNNSTYSMGGGRAGGRQVRLQVKQVLCSDSGFLFSSFFKVKDFPQQDLTC